jgi:hypothetical protein
MTATGRSNPGLLFFHSPTEGSSRRVEGFLAQVLQRRRNHETAQAAHAAAPTSGADAAAGSGPSESPVD